MRDRIVGYEPAVNDRHITRVPMRKLRQMRDDSRQVRKRRLMLSIGGSREQFLVVIRNVIKIGAHLTFVEPEKLVIGSNAVI